MATQRFVALDRDGTLIVERNYLSDPADVQLIPGAGAALRRLREMGLGLVVLTNQSAIGRGRFSEARLAEIHDRLTELLRAAGARLDVMYYCPHTPEDDCRCRKPRSGLMEQAARELSFDPRESIVIGDKPCDVELGRAVGATTLLVRTGYGSQMAKACEGLADYTAESLPAAVSVIQRLLARPRGAARRTVRTLGAAGCR